jgi:hypothetical protein
LLWYARENFDDFMLRLQFRLNKGDDNSGVFVRSRNPSRRVPDRNDPNVSHVYNNKAWVAVDTGFEVQIDELARPDGLDQHRTGAIYNIPLGAGAGQQTYQPGPNLQADVWYEYEIEVTGQTYTVRLKEAQAAAFQQVTAFTNTDAFRGKPPTSDEHSGYIGVQAHTGQVAFRNIRIKTS